MKFQIWTIFFCIACIGWLAGLIIHIMTLLHNMPNHLVWILHVGIFVVWLPFIIRVKKENPSLDSGHGLRQPVLIKNMLKHAPTAVRYIAIGGFIYAMVNHFYLAFSSDLKSLEPSLNTFRTFSGGWIAFYGVAAAGLFPEKQKVE